MAGAPATPNNFTVQSANRQILVSWDMSVGATSYTIQRSADNITYSTLATITGSPLATSYLDTSAVVATQYWYKVMASNGSGDSQYTIPQSEVAVPTGEMCLSQIRLQAQQRADRVNSNFVSMKEWNANINKAMFELYDLLITNYEDYFMAQPIQFTTDGTSYLYPLPNGVLTFQDAINPNSTITAKPFYKLLGMDMVAQNANNGRVNIQKFNFNNRNTYFYPNTASTIYGVFNLQYRIMGNNIMFMPTPSANQPIVMWYIPRLTELLQDTDTTDISISGWIEYVIVRAAKYALDKEESDSSKLDQEILFLKSRIEEAASNRDAGQADTISNTRGNYGYGWGSGGWNNGKGGF